MDKKTAQIILDLNQFDSPLEAYEHQLFKLRNFILTNPIIPKVLNAKTKKSKQLEQAAENFIDIDYSISSYELKVLKGEHLYDKFIIYEKNKSLIKSNLSKHLSSKNIQFGIEQLLTNLQMWSKELENIDTSEAKDVPLTKEMDVLILHESLKMNKIKVEPMSQELLAEFKRIKLLGSGIVKC